MAENVLPLRMTPAAALRIIQEIAADTSRVVILVHAKQGMKKRRSTRSQVYSCLRCGVITEGPTLDIQNYWRCTMSRLVAGDEVSIVVSFIPRFACTRISTRGVSAVITCGNFPGVFAWGCSSVFPLSLFRCLPLRRRQRPIDRHLPQKLRLIGD